MDCNRIYNAYFSPSGTTKKISRAVSSVLSENITSLDFLASPPTQPVEIPKDAPLVIAMPVFAGRIPPICVSYIKALKGQGTPAVAIVVYGNRAYGSALLELCDLISAQGFLVIGAAAFVAQHSVIQNVAYGRPDNADFGKLIEFACQCSSKLDAFAGFSAKLDVPGKRPYNPYTALALVPKADKKCNGCGACAKLCPAGAIDLNKPLRTDKNKCICCTACIAVCPVGARAFRGFVFKVAGKAFARKCVSRMEPEWFT